MAKNLIKIIDFFHLKKNSPRKKLEATQEEEKYKVFGKKLW
jgi:hypothetical protein